MRKVRDRAIASDGGKVAEIVVDEWMKFFAALKSHEVLRKTSSLLHRDLCDHRVTVFIRFGRHTGKVAYDEDIFVSAHAIGTVDLDALVARERFG